MEQTEYPPMSGSNTICVVTVLIETGMVPVQMPITRLTLDTPAGLVEVEAEVSDRKVTRVTFRNVPSFAVHLDSTIEVKAWARWLSMLPTAGCSTSSRTQISSG